MDRYVLSKPPLPIAPLVLTMIVGPITEANVRCSVQTSGGDASILVGSPISITLLALAAIVLVLSFVRAFRPIKAASSINQARQRPRTWVSKSVARRIEGAGATQSRFPVVAMSASMAETR